MMTSSGAGLTASQYWPRQSKPHQGFDKSISSIAADFRNLAPVVVAAALRRAGTRVCRPVDRFELDLPEAAHGIVVGQCHCRQLVTLAMHSQFLRRVSAVGEVRVQMEVGKHHFNSIQNPERGMDRGAWSEVAAVHNRPRATDR